MSLWAQKKETKKDVKGSEDPGQAFGPDLIFQQYKFRSVGPAWASGRIADLAVNPLQPFRDICRNSFRQHLEEPEQRHHMAADI